MTAFEIATLCLSALLIIVGTPAIFALRREIGKDRDEQIKHVTKTDDEVADLRKDLDHAFDEIREIKADAVNNKIIMERFTTSLDEVVRVLHRVEEKIDRIRDLEARFNAHVEQEGKR